jgi:hypothetical protein
MKMFKNQTNIFNPETNESYTHSDIEIWKFYSWSIFIFIFFNSFEI